MIDDTLSKIDFSEIDFFYTGYCERNGIYNGNLISVYPFAISMSPLDQKTIDNIKSKWIVKTDIFYYHYNDFRKGEIDRDPCDIYAEISGKPHLSDLSDVRLLPEKYTENQDNLIIAINNYKAYQKGCLRDSQIDSILTD